MLVFISGSNTCYYLYLSLAHVTIYMQHVIEILYENGFAKEVNDLVKKNSHLSADVK